jgi:hypothetical protein
MMQMFTGGTKENKSDHLTLLYLKYPLKIFDSYGLISIPATVRACLENSS